MFRWLIVFCIFVSTGMLKAEDRTRAILVLDASGSMWGQIDGVAKITIAQDVIGNLLQDLPPNQELGLTAYGHRRKGDCGDIETLILPEGDQRAAISTAVNGIKPKGKTPLSAAVIQAAEALRYTEEAATVILVSDGRETCDYDPCAVGRELEDAGINFTAHVIGFDITDQNDRAQLQCLAEETGGTFRTASDAGELADALLVVAEPPEPEQRDVTLRALDAPGGVVMTSDVSWVVTNAAGETIYDSGDVASPTLPLDLGEYNAQAIRGKDNAKIALGFPVRLDTELVTLVFPALPPEPVTIAYEAYIEETNTLIKDPLVWDVYDAEGTAIVSSNVVYKDKVDLLPGEYRIEVLRPEDESFASAKVTVSDSAKTVKLKLPKIVKLATVSAPETAVAGSTVMVEWTGPNEEDDFISVTTVDGSSGSWDEYTYTKEGSPLKLLMPASGGTYEIRYVLNKGRESLAATTVKVTPVTATLTPPAELAAGSTVSVAWTGPNYPQDFIAVAKKGEDGWINYAYTKDGSPAALQMPGEAGDYDIIYTMEQDRTVIQRVGITVTDIEFGLTAPETAIAGSIVDVAWVGPNYPRDFITLSEVDARDGSYLSYTYTKEGTPLGLQMPLVPGTYEIRYVLEQDRIASARRLIEVTAITGGISGPSEAAAGSHITVNWKGPNYERDYVTIAAIGAQPNAYVSYAYTKNGDPAKLQMPSEAGDYELRYIADGKPDLVLASQPIKITAVSATLTADDRVTAGAPFQVSWDGPGNDRDFITISKVEDESGYIKYKYARDGSPVTLEAPADPGTYELRYFLDMDRKIIGRRSIVVE